MSERREFPILWVYLEEKGRSWAWVWFIFSSSPLLPFAEKQRAKIRVDWCGLVTGSKIRSFCQSILEWKKSTLFHRIPPPPPAASRFDAFSLCDDDATFWRLMNVQLRSSWSSSSSSFMIIIIISRKECKGGSEERRMGNKGITAFPQIFLSKWTLIYIKWMSWRWNKRRVLCPFSPFFQCDTCTIHVIDCPKKDMSWLYMTLLMIL